MKNVDFLLIGKNGFLGSFINDSFIRDKINFTVLDERLEDPVIYEKIKYYNPKYIICAAGIVGKPNRDWCLRNPVETINTNVISHYNLALYCKNNNIKILFLDQ